MLDRRFRCRRAAALRPSRSRTFSLRRVCLQIPRLRPKQYRQVQPWKRTVSRAYGGCLSATAVRERIVRAFIIEEQKIVKRMLESKIRASKA